MRITRVSSQRLKQPDPRSRYIMTKENPYVMLDRKQHYWDKDEGKTSRAPVLNKDLLIKIISDKHGNKLGVKQTSQ